MGSGSPTVASVMLALLLCGFLGVVGQGVRAVVGLKNAGSLNSTTPGEQAVFSLAYLSLSLLIGFIAGVLAGIALGLQDIITIDPGNWKLLLGITASGYVGADFIENTMSVVIPGAAAPSKAPPAVVAQTALPRERRGPLPSTPTRRRSPTPCASCARRPTLRRGSPP